MRIQSQNGVTLLEILLVLAISTLTIVSVVALYQQYHRNAVIAALKYNVDTLLQASSLYYQVNCKGILNGAISSTNGTMTNGKLNPASGVSTSSPYAISIANDLQGGGGGPVYLTSWQPSNSLVDTTSTDAYVVQFNPQLLTREVYNNCVLTSGGSTSTQGVSCLPASPNSTYELGSTSGVLVWTIQVAVKLADTSTADFYKGLTNADCESDIDGSGVVAPCASATGNAYLVWNRLPSAIASQLQTSYAQSLQRSDQSNIQYSHDQMYELSNAAWANTQYYLCGG